jgi:hypothetical protein
MKTIRSLILAIMALVMLFSFVSAVPASDVNDIEKRGYKFYPLRCNSANLHVLDRQAAIYEAWQSMHDNGNESGSFVVTDNGKKFAEKCAGPVEACTKVTIKFFGEGPPFAKYKYLDLAAAMQRISDECGEKGGSVEIPGGSEKSVVHMSDYWV